MTGPVIQIFLCLSHKFYKISSYIGLFSAKDKDKRQNWMNLFVLRWELPPPPPKINKEKCLNNLWLLRSVAPTVKLLDWFADFFLSARELRVLRLLLPEELWVFPRPRLKIDRSDSAPFKTAWLFVGAQSQCCQLAFANAAVGKTAKTAFFWFRHSCVHRSAYVGALFSDWHILKGSAFKKNQNLAYW